MVSRFTTVLRIMFGTVLRLPNFGLERATWDAPQTKSGELHLGLLDSDLRGCLPMECPRTLTNHTVKVMSCITAIQISVLRFSSKFQS